MPDKSNPYRYCIFFALAYGALLALVNIAIAVFNIEVGSALNIASLVAAIYISAYKFAKEQDRIPEKTEKKKIAVGCLLTAYAISLIIAIITALLSGLSFTALFQGISPVMLFMSIVIVTIIYLTAIYLSYGWFVRIALKIINRR